MKKILEKLLLFIRLISLMGCSAPQQNEAGTDTGVQSESEAEEDNYQVHYIDIQKEEKEKVERLLSLVGDSCKDIYSRADKGDSSDVVLDEETVHKMAEAAASQGVAVTCGNYDYNMLNYEKVDEILCNAPDSKDSETEFYEITTNGYIKYFGLQLENQELIVTYANAAFDEAMVLHVQQLEKFKVYDWEYTEKGWLIWEKALSRNQEMDMHSFVRILPLDEKCRELGNKYIRPVSYFCNNLFLVDWDINSMDKIEFNDLYDFLYEMKYGEKLNQEEVQEGIAKGEFESVIRTFFDISTEDIESFARYDFENMIYPWEPIGAWNRVQQFQPFPEVVKCTENPDGTWALYVEAVLVEDGTDCSFKHTVTMKEKDGRWIYLGNDVDDDGEGKIPGYKPRREFTPPYS